MQIQEFEPIPARHGWQILKFCALSFGRSEQILKFVVSEGGLRVWFREFLALSFGRCEQIQEFKPVSARHGWQILKFRASSFGRNVQI